MKEIIPTHRLFDKNLAGGAILDVGLYPVSLSRLIAGVDAGKNFLDPINVVGEGRIGITGVDEIASAKLKFENDVEAEVSTSILQNMENNAERRARKG